MAPVSSRHPVYALPIRLCAALWLVLAPAVAIAHHSFVVVYDVQRSLTVQATIASFLYRNPHAVLQLDVRVADGSTQCWTAQWGGLAQLKREGVTSTSLKVGDRVVVTGSPARQPGLHLLRLQAVHRPADGWTWRGVTP